jgi:cytochrome c-type biogenesis protein
LSDISIFLALGAGLLSFFSPCILPLIPVYLSFITGLSADRLGDSKTGGLSNNFKEIMPEMILFILGFTFVFIALGASATYLSNILFVNKKLIKIIGGVIVIIFGLQLAGILNIKFLQSEKKIHLKNRPVGRVGAFIIGAVFALGWTPCLGPILGSILTLAAAANTVSKGILLLSFYSLGLAIPFILTGLFVGWVLSAFSKIKKYFRFISLASGLLLVFMGIGLITGFLKF